jgi:coenzyme Q-binding protein COQ10
MLFKGFLPAVTKHHVEKRILAAHPLHLFRIIQDVDQYAKFLPLCTHSKVLQERHKDGSFQATLTVGMPPFFQETYVSHVTVIPEQLTIETKSIQSSYFDSLRSRWTLRHLEEEPGKVDVDFFVELTVSDPLIVSVLDQVLQTVAGQQVDAFEKRCQQVPLPPELQQTQ